MQGDWIIDVLTDLKTFASANNLNALAEQLDDTILVAASEIAARAEEAHSQVHGELGKTGQDTAPIGASQRA